MNLRQRSTLQIIFVFLLFTLIVTSILILTQRVYLGYSNNQEIIQSMQSTSIEKEKLFKSFLYQSEQTLYAIRGLSFFDKYMDQNSYEKTLQEIFIAYSKSQPSFMQLRYIDKDGYERIRVDRKKEDTEPYLVAKDNLQNKENRYYFNDSKTKELEKVWFSALDLNIERGKVEVPYKPTLRAVLPIKHKDEFGGIIIINYFMEGFLKKFVDLSLYDMILFNSKGYPLYHYEKDKSWGFYKDKKFNIKEQYPNYFEQIVNNESFKSDDFIAKRLDVAIYGDLYMIVKLKQSYIQEEKDKLSLQGFYTLIIIFILSIPLSILMVKIFSKTLFNLETVNQLNKDLQSLNRELEESEYEVQIMNESLEQQVRDKTKENLEQFEVIQQQSKMAAMGEMLANISHQWRQPLNALSALIFNIKFKYELGKLDDESVAHFTDKSSLIIKTMDNTIDDFRNFFKPDKQRKVFDICESINIAMNIIECSYKNNNISIETSCDNVELDGYKSELEQVLLVVLGNSKDAIKEKKISDGKVSIRVYNNDTTVEIEIEDNGGGIKDDIISRVFEPYFTTKHQDVGTGIGLYMSKMIIEKSMNGIISIKNENDGCLTTIVLPKGKK